MEYFIDDFKNFADFSDRARPQQCWMFVLFNFLIALAIAIVEGF
jgi:uncharacterized membrane protein YhaH (DUF805 family)